MADNEIKVKVVAEADIEPLQEMDSLLDEIQEKTEVQVSVDDSEIEEATDKTTELTDELDNVDDADPSIDVDDTALEDATDKASELADELDSIDGTTVSVDVDTSGLEDAKASAEETASSIDSISTAMVGIGATVGLDQMIETADRVNTSWNQLELTFSNAGVSVNSLKPIISSLGETTGRSGTQIRDYFNQMGLVGVTNTDLLARSFESMAGQSYKANTSIENVESAVQRMVLSGNMGGKMLSRLGMSSRELADAMGVTEEQAAATFKSLSESERLEVLTKAMGDGTRANEMYKNSYAGLKSQADIALGGLKNAIGQAILPIVIPAIKAAAMGIKALTDGFKALPGPVQAIIGGVGGFAAIALTLIGVLGTVGQVFKMVKGGLEALHLITKLETLANYALAVSEWLVANPLILVAALVIALAAAFVWAYYNVDWFREAVDNLAATLQWVAGVVYDEVMKNLQFMIDAFTEFTSALGLNTSDWKQAILGFILFLPMLPAKFAEMTINTIARALGFGDDFTQRMVDAASNAFNGFMDWIRQLPDAFRAELETMLTDADNFRIALPGALGVAANLMVDAWKAGSGEGSPGYMYQAFIEELSAMLGLTPEFTAQLVNAFLLGGLRMVAAWVNSSATLINNVVSFGTKFVSQLTSIAQRGVSAFSNAIQGIVTALQNCLSWAYNVVMSSPLVSALQWLGQQASYAFSVLGLGQGSPGKIVKHMKEELQWTSEAVQNSDLAKDTARLGASMADSFNPAITPLTDSGGTGIVGGDTIINIYGDVDNEDRVKQIVDAVRRELNWDNKTAGRTV